MLAKRFFELNDIIVSIRNMGLIGIWRDYHGMAQCEQKKVERLKSGKSAEEIIKMYE